jgi:hypothetical protein
VSESIHNAILKLLALLLGLWGLVCLIEGLDRGGAFGKIWAVAVGLFVIWTAVGFWRRRGWAFLVVSVGLLLSFLSGVVTLIIAVDRGEGVRARAVALALTIVLIGYLGRWSIERRFRPHLDARHH